MIRLGMENPTYEKIFIMDELWDNLGNPLSWHPFWLLFATCDLWHFAEIPWGHRIFGKMFPSPDEKRPEDQRWLAGKSPIDDILMQGL